VIRVLVDDLAFLPVDAVVRPANDTLDPVTPLGTRLDQRAGPWFLQQRTVRSPLDVGAAVVTGAGALEAQFVLHVVIQSAEVSVGPDTVRRALVSAWHRATEWDLATVATPLIGTGAGGLTVEEAATVLAETYRRSAAEGGRPADLSIVVEREGDRALVQAIVARESF
jgi:O-acetyl-ADP-ribose deacetylase (regulator of RNase III)